MNLRELILIAAAIAAIVAIPLGMSYHYSNVIFGLEKRIDELGAENIKLEDKVFTLEKTAETKEKYFDLMVTLITEGTIAIKDIELFLPEEEVKEVEEEVSKLEIPFPVNIDLYFYPSGWMGDGEYITFTRTDEHIKITYAPGPKGWAGIYWQYPDSNWGERPGRNLIGAKRLVFWAKGEIGNEIIEFKTGGIRDKKYEDSFEKSLGRIKLTQGWEQYEIDLDGQDLSSVIGGFAWIASKDANPNGVTFYLNDIYFEK